uniref:Uncharacterized protein n=1 Tax=Sphaerodactylus townsendi TaxID=933632 RepID=A0ACB8GDQ7_9SAUR
MRMGQKELLAGRLPPAMLVRQVMTMLGREAFPDSHAGEVNHPAAACQPLERHLGAQGTHAHHLARTNVSHVADTPRQGLRAWEAEGKAVPSAATCQHNPQPPGTTQAMGGLSRRRD